MLPRTGERLSSPGSTSSWLAGGNVPRHQRLPIKLIVRGTIARPREPVQLPSHQPTRA
jgi:hypothetical protein